MNFNGSFEDLMLFHRDMLMEHKGYRRGQALYNALVLCNPVLADEIHGTDRDCFYWDDSEVDRLDELLKWIESVYDAC